MDKVSLNLMNTSVGIVKINISDATGYISREIDRIFAIYFSYRYYTTIITPKLVRLFQTKSLESIRADVYFLREYLYNSHSYLFPSRDMDLLVSDLYSYYPVITEMDKDLVKRTGIEKYLLDDNDFWNCI